MLPFCTIQTDRENTYALTGCPKQAFTDAPYARG